jgi:shikimate kinase
MMAKKMIQMSKPIVLVGQMGSGKSALGKQLSQDIQLPFYDLDEVITEHTQQSIPEIFQKSGESEFRQIEHFCLQMLLKRPEAFILSTGGGAPCFFDNMQLILDASLAVYLKTDAFVLANRLNFEKNHRPLIKGLPGDQLTNFLIQQLEARANYYEKAHLIIDGSRSLEENSSYIQSFLTSIKPGN